MEELVRYVEELRREFNLHLYRRVRGSIDPYIAGNVLLGGKRLRPILLLMVFRSLGGKDLQRALDVACALELAHNASLAHDDIIDVDMERRGRPTLWRQIGIGRAIIEGHRIINLAFQIALNEGVEIAKIFLNTWNRASSGALMELVNRELPGQILYMKIIREKTAALFEAAAECGAILAGAPGNIVKEFKLYGEKVGVAYQLADDYVDMYKGRFSIRSPILFYNRFEEKLRQILIPVKLGKTPPLRKILSPRINWKEFLVKEIAKSIRAAWDVVDRIGVEEPHRTYLRRFPEYCVQSMFRELQYP